MDKTIKRITIEIDSGEINIVYKKGTLYFNKSDISKIFDIDKIIIKEILKSLNLNNKCKYLDTKGNKIIKIYSLDAVLLIGYKLKDYDTTKELVKINKIVKDRFEKKEYALDLFKSKYNLLKEKLILSLSMI